MCGRYTRTRELRELAESLGIDRSPAQPPRYNIAPTDLVACVRTNLDTRERECVFLHWGFLPSRAKGPAIGPPVINARVETAPHKPMFRRALRERRCLVLADGFYEWATRGGIKYPYYFRLHDHRPFAFAGLWERWAPVEHAPRETCVILTTEANDIVRPFHARMPVIVDPRYYALWLDPDMRTPGSLQPVFASEPSQELEAVPVGRWVNRRGYDGPRCLEPDSTVRFQRAMPRERPSHAP